MLHALPRIAVEPFSTRYLTVTPVDTMSVPTVNRMTAECDSFVEVGAFTCRACSWLVYVSGPADK